MNLERCVYSRSLCITLLRFALVLAPSEENFDRDQEHENQKSEQATFENIYFRCLDPFPTAGFALPLNS